MTKPERVKLPRLRQRAGVLLVASVALTTAYTVPTAHADEDAAVEEVPSQETFVDVPGNSYFTEAVAWSVENDITGIDGDKFEPYRPVTRGEAAVWLWRMQNPAMHEPNMFTDVSGHQAQAVAYLKDNNITTGTSPTMFSPERILTRAEAATFLWRLAGEPTPPSLSFADVTSEWQRAPVAWVSQTNITSVKPPEAFSPDSEATRAQWITFLYRYSTGVGDPITVPETRARGRCADTIARDIYEWEFCAWQNFRESDEHNYPLSDSEAAELISRVWAEVYVEGKPANAPTSELAPLGVVCAAPIEGGGFTIGCYQRAENHIRRTDALLDTLLHELAHALVRDHPSIAECSTVSGTNQYRICISNDIFRCVADHLYVTYAKIPSAGVCGTATPPVARQSQDTWGFIPSLSGRKTAYVNAFYHSLPYPHEGATASLVVRCKAPDPEADDDSDDLDVYLWLESGYLAGQHTNNELIPVSYVFGSYELLDWDELRRAEYVLRNIKTGDWHESRTKRGAFIPQYLHREFLNSVVSNDWAYLNVEQYDGSNFGVFAFLTDGSLPKVQEVTEECGWTWEDGQGDPGGDQPSAPTRWNSYDYERGTIAQVDAYSTESPSDLIHNGRNTLFVRCLNPDAQDLFGNSVSDLSVFIRVRSGQLFGDHENNNLIEAHYVSGPAEVLEWDEQRRDNYISENKKVSFWRQAISRKGMFAPSTLEGDFIDELTENDWMFVFVRQLAFDEETEFRFYSDNAEGHLRRVTEACDGE
ncbi:MAG: S-layer homology domain-containing protein [Acidimicrobiaceae bacterium]|nr:S-layer homology domain-containing protein [Acidimicrobiaceae bacterium]MYC41226.1 S-layer homology domain-containing protein [Acidimicrobiaceae bacterium]